MASMRDIKRRKSSIQSTGQITKAMKLVSTVKLQKSRQKAESSSLYFDLMYQTISSMLKKSPGTIDHYLKSGRSRMEKRLSRFFQPRSCPVAIITTLSSSCRKEARTPKENALIFAIGRKGRDGLARRAMRLQRGLFRGHRRASLPGCGRSQKSCWPHSAVREIGEIYLAYGVL